MELKLQLLGRDIWLSSERINLKNTTNKSPQSEQRLFLILVGVDVVITCTDEVF